jgi:transcriptional regulator with XRE-family HTH domain
MADKVQYNSVSDLVRDMAPDAEFRAAFEERRNARRLIKQLMAMRALKGFSQHDIADKLACTQSRVSKLERSCDDDTRLGDLRAYAEALDCDVLVGVLPRGLTPVEKVKSHVLAIKKHTDDLANLAKSDENIARGVAQFYFELMVNFSRLVGDSVRALPNGPDDLPYFTLGLEVGVGEQPPEQVRQEPRGIKTEHVVRAVS